MKIIEYTLDKYILYGKKTSLHPAYYITVQNVEQYNNVNLITDKRT